ncbi:MAG: substrate-binding domain-containing protein [Candidatus Aureabacteria bacterium]|nr:substrate-binding domain-containing protein [Candidatus Auribacterota bacterium]
MKRFSPLFFLALMLLASTCIPSALIAADRVKLATTTSTADTGLLDAILPAFEKRFNLKVDVIPVGTGQAIVLARNGDVDVVLVHAREKEDEFVKSGCGVNRRDVMYNDFVIVGPPDDSAGIRGKKSAVEAVESIARSGCSFVSRGDESGTHIKEKELWKSAGIAPSGKWYLEAGQGMGATLVVANEKKAYCLADRATFMAFRDKISLAILYEGDSRLMNRYGVIAVSPARYPRAKYIQAMSLIAWLTSPEGQKMIGDFKKNGLVLFHPSAYGEVGKE